MPKAAFYATIPAPVRYCKELEPNAKLLYGEITALSEQEGYCWAENTHFAELYDVDIRTIQRWLQSLKKLKFISIDADEKGSRRIWISPEIKKVFTHDKNVIGARQKCHPPYIDINVYKEDNTAASQLSDFFLQKIKSNKPDFTKGVSPKWIKDFEKLLKIRSVDELKKIINWIFESSFWSTVVLSTTSLIKNLDQIELQLNKPKQHTQEKEKWLDLLKTRVTNRRDINFGPEGIAFTGGQSYFLVKFTDHGFKDQVLSRLRKMGIDVSGL